MLKCGHKKGNANGLCECDIALCQSGIAFCGCDIADIAVCGYDVALCGCDIALAESDIGRGRECFWALKNNNLVIKLVS